jgi:dTDP-4-amino-4,6-dideoxygalactose transaminase
MTDLQGAVGLVQLSKLDSFIAERSQRAARYQQELAAIPWLISPIVPEGYDHAWQAYVTTIDTVKAPRSRNEIMDILQKRGIATRPGTHAVHMLGYYRDRFGLKPGDFPVARDCDADTMAIPLHNRMTEADFAYVVETLKGIN